MSYAVTYEECDGYLRFTWSGDAEIESMLEAWRHVFASAIAAGVDRVLVEITYTRMISTIDAYEMMERFTASLPPEASRLRVARVFHGGTPRDRHRFSENLAVNRGIRMASFFDSAEEAIEWLRS